MSNKNYNIYIPKHKHNNLNHERNMTNFQLNNINYNYLNISDEIIELRERENKMNGIKDEINKNKFISNNQTKKERRNREQILSEPNLDLDKIINNKNHLLNNYFEEKNNVNEKIFQVSPINQNKEEIIDFENFDSNKISLKDFNNSNSKNNKNEIFENKFLNDNQITSASNNKQIINNLSEEFDEINNMNKDNQNVQKFGHIKKIKNINPNVKNKLSLHKKIKSEQLDFENGSTKNQDIVNKLKIENVNLKTKIGLLRAALEKKDKRIHELINQNKELEKYKNNNNNNDENKIYEKMENKINALKIEKNILFNKNKNLILGIESLNERIKEINLMIENQKMIFDREQNNSKKKLAEYRKKIILLKRRINELYSNNSYKANNTYNNDSNILLNYSNLRNKDNILFKTYKRKDIIDLRDNYTHHRYNTFIKDYKNYLENIH